MRVGQGTQMAHVMYFLKFHLGLPKGGRDRRTCGGGKTNNTRKPHSREYYNWMSFVNYWICI
jgi:hypothetical protein